MKNLIGDNIRKFRNILGLTQDDLANYLNIKRELISYYETSKRNVPVTHLNKLCDLFGIELEELLEENEEIRNINLVFAFRSGNLNSDLENIASFKRIVLNYIKMNSILNGIQD